MSNLVGRGIRVFRRCETDTRVCGVKDTVETLEEGLAVVETLSGGGPEVVHDAVNRAGRAAEVGVERPRPDLAVGGQRVRDLEGATSATVVR